MGLGGRWSPRLLGKAAVAPVDLTDVLAAPAMEVTSSCQVSCGFPPAEADRGSLYNAQTTRDRAVGSDLHHPLP